MALEVVKGDKYTAELAQLYGVHPAMITNWKKQLIENAQVVFEQKSTSDNSESQVDTDTLCK